MLIDPVLPFVVAIALLAIILGLILRQLKQPYVIGYIAAGIVIGSFAGDLFGIREMLSGFGNLGVVLLLFFIGMHINLRSLVARWRVAIIGTLLQILLTVGVVWLAKPILGWDTGKVLLFGFALSLSSTAVVLKILQDRKQLDTKVGQNVLGILLVQDLAVIPMMLLLARFAPEPVQSQPLWVQLIGFAGVLLLVIMASRARRLRIPFARVISRDHELQVFTAILLCFGLALVTGELGISPALGAFVAGIIVGSARSTAWVQDRLDSFHVLFVAIFFVYVGLLIDLPFVWEHLGLVLLLALGAFVFNALLNATVLRILGDAWRESWYAGVLLSQIGEFSFILGSLGYAYGIIDDYGHQLLISVIVVTLLLSPLWISLARRFTRIDAAYVFELPERLVTAVADAHGKLHRDVVRRMRRR